jgi:DNA-directed RNA polymerase subunit RPC12/RpoP
MDSESYIKSACSHCGGHIEAPAEGAGMWVRCPHCGQKTQLTDSAGKPSAAKSDSDSTTADWSDRRLWIFVVGVVVVAAVLAAFWLRRTRQSFEQLGNLHITAISQPKPTPTFAPAPAPESEPQSDLWKGLKPAAVTIQKTGNSRLIYAVGLIRNDTDKQRFGVKVTLDVLDSKREKLGTTSDYTQFIDAHKEWNFRALVTDPKATSAKVTAITEE